MKIKLSFIVKKSTIKAENSRYKQNVGFYLYFFRIYNKVSYISLEEMKVKDDLRDMFKKIIIFDVILAAILYWTTNMFFRNYSLIVLLGLIVAFITFIFNGILTRYALLNKKDKYQLIALIGFVIRVLAVCGIATAVFNHNKFNVIAYIFGYSAQFISIILYGINMKNE